MNDTLAAAIHRFSGFLDDHWVFKYYVVPTVLMATMLFLLALVNPRVTDLEGGQLVALFVAFSLLIAAVGVASELLLRRLGMILSSE